MSDKEADEKAVYDTFMETMQYALTLSPPYNPNREHWFPHVEGGPRSATSERFDQFVSALTVEQRTVLSELIEDVKRHTVGGTLYALDAYNIFTQDGVKVPRGDFGFWQLDWLDLTSPAETEL